MSNGGGQLVVLPLGSAFPNFKMYHYTTGGGTILKNIYSDEDLQTTMAQPAVADVNGVIQFYALGDFRIKIDDENDINKYDWDDYHISKGQPLITDYSTALPAATVANKGHLYSVIDSSNVLRNVAVNQNTSFVSIYTANASGVRSDSNGLFSSYPWYDITHPDWGAVASQASDQTANIQAAIDAIEAADGGVLFIPEGEFQVDGSLDINNVKIAIVGQGVGKSILKQTADAAAPLIDYDTDDITETFELSGMSLRTTFAGAGNCIDCNWPTATTDLSNCYIHDVEIGPTDAASATAYFDIGIVLSDTSNYRLKEITVTGKDADVASMTAGINLTDACIKGVVSGCKVKNAAKGVFLEDTSADSVITTNIFENVTKGIVLASTCTDNLVFGNISDLTAVIENLHIGINPNILYNNFPLNLGTATSFTDADVTPSVEIVSNSDGLFTVANTGATIITDFDNGYEGQVIRVRATTDNTTLDNNSASLNIIGLSDYTMLTGDITSLVLVGGVWIEQSRAAKGTITLAESSTPATPTSNRATIWLDSATNDLRVVWDSGNVAVIATHT